MTHDHHSTLGKLVHSILPETNDPDKLEEEKHEAMSSHEREEARADALIASREASERAHPSASGPPDLVPVSAAHDLSSVPHRAALEDAAEGRKAGRATTPDLDGVTHIPESELPVRHERMENTATRPADPNDPKSMNGLPDNWTTAGDDRML
ncbi:hypothetical protein JCM10207_002151 [Rhodosporidiobolus poonsookiae]